MKALIVCVALAIGVSHPGMAQTGKMPAIEQSIYKPAPPFENTKKSLYVREGERPVLDLISDASTSIARFLQQVLFKQLDGTGASDGMRLPPLASADGATRFVGSTLYCWSSQDQDHLEFLIDWADITTNARYTDSYVFVRRGPEWRFEKHGSVPPRYWLQTERYFQWVCPSLASR